MTAGMTTSTRSQSLQVFMLLLCLFALAILAAQTLFTLSEATKEILEYADLVICVLFLLDFVHSLITAKDRWRYLYTWGWLDLLSSIPAIDALRVGRAARLLRILRVLRGVRATKILTEFILTQRAKSAALAAALMTLLLLVFSSIAIVQLEDAPTSNIKSGGDAMWWALTTITTVGYGDRFPVTTEGRMVAAVLMFMGVALFAIISGSVAAWFLAPGRSRNDELQELREELRGVIRRLDELREGGSG